MKRLIGMLSLFISLSGCVTSPVRPVATADQAEPVAVTNDCSALEDADRLRLSLIEDELHGNRPRAALAYLDGLPETLKVRPKAVYLRAEAYRDVAEYDLAGRLYQRLSKGCLAGAGYHGLGLIAAAQQHLDSALFNLHQARVLLPADPRVRNDYGYALLLAGRAAEARVEFETVLELSDQQPKAASNLILAMLVSGQEQEALHYAQAIKLDAARLTQLRQRARSLQSHRQEDKSDADLH
jgi:Flp pilus assembly protein TadD